MVDHGIFKFPAASLSEEKGTVIKIIFNFFFLTERTTEGDKLFNGVIFVRGK